MVHQYEMYVKHYFLKEVSFRDIVDFSCLNGWTCGNIAASAIDIARFYAHLGSGHIVNVASLKQMCHFDPLSVGWAVGLPYGLGLMPQGSRTMPGGPNEGAVILLGHGGMDWGSTSQYAGWAPYLGNIGINVQMSSSQGMNCSLQNFDENYYAGSIVPCVVYNATLAVMNATVPQYKGQLPQLDCFGKFPHDDAETFFAKRKQSSSSGWHCATKRGF